jgi:hypothetical protein
MSGFPVRPSRTAFGPKPVNRYPVVNPAQQMDGPTIGDLLFWQVSGLGQTGALAWAFIAVAAGAIDVPNVVTAEAWNPNKDQTAPTITRTGLGIYRVQYAATYPDKDAVAQNTPLTFGLPIPQGLGATGHEMFATVTKVDVRTFDVKTWRRDTMAADDCSVAVLFW